MNPAHSIQYKALLALYRLSLDRLFSKSDALLPVIVQKYSVPLRNIYSAPQKFAIHMWKF